MRKGVNEVGKSILNRLKKFDEISEFAATILHIELLAVGCNMIESNLKLQDAWSLLTRYDEPIIAENRDKTLLGKLRILLSHFSGQSYLEKEIERYLEIPIKYRLIDIDHNGQIVFGTPQYFPERKQKYINILQAPIENRENKLKYAEVGPFTYRRRKEDLYMEVKGSIPESWIKGVEKLPAYREKKSIQFDLDFDWSEVARDMDRILGNGKREWEKRIEHIQFQATDGEKIFSYHGVQHIVGGLSAGKSTFRTINTYWLVKKKGAMVGILEGSVAQVLERVRELRNLGIKAVPIIGKTERRKHLNNYLSSHRIQTVGKLYESEQLSHLSDLCLIHSLTDDLNETVNTTHNPCKNLMQEGTKVPKMCPLFHLCGVLDLSQYFGHQ